MKRVAGVGIFILLAIVSACTSDAATPAPAGSIDTPKQTPTVASIFTMPATPTVATLQPIASATIAPAAPSITVTPTQATVYEVPIYQDALNAGWTVSNSQGISIDMANTAIVMSGTRAISFTPQVDYGMLYFTLEPNAPLTLPYDKVVGISLRINGGDAEIGPSDLSLSLHGSNAYTYWTKNDNSVPLSDQVQFSETRLYDLEITRARSKKYMGGGHCLSGQTSLRSNL